MTESRCGLLLLTGGGGLRLGGPKHLRPHPAGGSWGGRLVGIFREVCPEGPVMVLGAPLPDLPGLPRMEDPREGPAVALRFWAGRRVPDARRWWVVPCDQVDWTAQGFEGWLEAAEAADPGGLAWALARVGQRPQPLGGLLGSALRLPLAGLAFTRVHELAAALPQAPLPAECYQGMDVDTPEDLQAWDASRGKGAFGPGALHR
ncbi:MAG TPA: NTP transferase domain-containing protein [Holophagaceae bacterium]|nr:NTP transferase domain-containing protein [Holophagaceae bacterium]